MLWWSLIRSHPLRLQVCKEGYKIAGTDDESIELECHWNGKAHILVTLYDQKQEPACEHYCQSHTDCKLDESEICIEGKCVTKICKMDLHNGAANIKELASANATINAIATITCR